MVFPLISDNLYSKYNHTLVGRDVTEENESITLLWTTAENVDFKEAITSNVGLTLNHIVALVRRSTDINGGQ